VPHRGRSTSGVTPLRPTVGAGIDLIKLRKLPKLKHYPAQ